MKNEFTKHSLALYGPDEEWIAGPHDLAPRGCFKGGGGGGGTQQVVQKSDPWAGQQPYLTEIFARAQQLAAVAARLNQLNAKAQPSTAVAQPAIPKPGAYPLDNALYYLLEENKGAGMMSIRFRNEDAPSFDVQVRLDEQRTGKFNWYYFDRSSLQIDKIDSHRHQAAGDRLASLNYDIHTGNIGGWPTKVIAFIISLFCASLPLTGYIIWINKAKKHKKGQYDSNCRKEVIA